MAKYPETVKALVNRNVDGFELVRVPGEHGGQVLAFSAFIGKDPFEAIMAAGRLIMGRIDGDRFIPGELRKDWDFASMHEQANYDIAQQTDAEVLASLNESIGITS